MIKKAWEEQKEAKNIMLFLQFMEYPPPTGHLQNLGNESLNVVKENPYRLADDI